VTTVKVTGVYKGDIRPRVRIFSGPPCGVDLPQGSGPLVIFAHTASDQARRRGAHYMVHLCGGSGQFTAEDIERATLGRAVPVRPVESSPASGQGSDGNVVTLLIELGVIGAAVAVIAGRMRRHR
jgi:hypothetical protein